MGEQYRLQIYGSYIPFPLCFALHTWVVLYSPEYGENRYEIFHVKNRDGGYFYKNYQSATQGMSYILIPRLFESKGKFKAKLIYEYTGDNVKDIILKLEGNTKNYPFKNEYRLYPGPNSNTFTQWVIEKVGIEDKVQLPWNAFGKKFKLKNSR